MRVCLFQSHSENNRTLWECTMPNHMEYCSRHRYDTIQLNREYHEYAWEWILDVREYLKRYDVVFSVGSDVIFTNLDKSIMEFWDPAFGIILSEEKVGGSPVNNDVSIYQRSMKTEWALQAMYNMRYDLADHPWLQQQAVIELMATPEGAAAFKVLPVRELQSTPVVSVPGYVSPSQWQSGDFALHFLGLPPAEKLRRCKHFLQTGEVLWRYPGG